MYQLFMDYDTSLILIEYILVFLLRLVAYKISSFQISLLHSLFKLCRKFNLSLMYLSFIKRLGGVQVICHVTCCFGAIKILVNRYRFQYETFLRKWLVIPWNLLEVISLNYWFITGIKLLLCTVLICLFLLLFIYFANKWFLNQIKFVCFFHIHVLCVWWN